MNPQDKAKQLIDLLQDKPIIEYTPFAGAKTQYTELNNREASICAKIMVHEILTEVARLDTKFNLGLEGTRQYWETVNIELDEFHPKN